MLLFKKSSSKKKNEKPLPLFFQPTVRD